MIPEPQRACRHRRRTASVVALLVAGSLLVGCTDSASPPPEPGSSEAPAPTPVPGPSERLGIEVGWGPSRDDLDTAARDVRRLRLPELAGQLIVAEWRGAMPPVALVRDLHLGGIITFESNVVSADQVAQVHRTLRRRVRRDWPLFLSVDQEGGVVERMRRVATRFPALMSAGAADDVGLTRAAHRAGAAELRGLGFTVDFAPDADVTSGPQDPTIGSRAVSSDPELASAHVVAAAEGFLAAGVLPVLKHFPGHGSVPADSHLTLPVQERTRAQLEASDLVPFRAAVRAGLPALMVGHLDVRSLDPRVPATLSRAVTTDLLREDLGFGGLVVTDSMSMAAVTRGRRPGRTAVQAVRAGADVVLMPPSPRVARDALVRAVREGHLRRSRLEQAATRQVALLRHLAGSEGRPVGSARAASRRLSAAALTVASGPCSGRLVGDAVHPQGDAAAVSTFAAAAQAVGITVLQRQQPPEALSTAEPEPVKRKRERRPAFRKRLRAWERAEARRERRLEDWVAREEARLAVGTSIGFAGYRGGPVSAQVAVATDAPWILGRSAAPVKIATYGDTPGAMGALVEVLLGRASAPGRLPVQVAGVERRGCD